MRERSHSHAGGGCEGVDAFYFSCFVPSGMAAGDGVFAHGIVLKGHVGEGSASWRVGAVAEARIVFCRRLFLHVDETCGVCNGSGAGDNEEKARVVVLKILESTMRKKKSIYFESYGSVQLDAMRT